MALVMQRSPSGSTQSDGDPEDDENRRNEKSSKTESSECFFADKEAALVDLKDIPHNATERRPSTDSTKSTNSTVSSSSDIQQHLQSMFYLLRHEETLKMAVKLESQRPGRTRYLAIVSRTTTNSKTDNQQNPQIKSQQQSQLQSNINQSQHLIDNQQINDDYAQQPQLSSFNSNMCSNANSSEIFDISIRTKEMDESFQVYNKNFNTFSDMKNHQLPSHDSNNSKIVEESCLLGIDCNEKTTIGLVLRILADTSIRLDGDGGFSITVFGKTHIFKPVSVQAMWSALQTLHKVSHNARANNFYPGGPSHSWVSYYETKINSDRSCLNEWNAMDSIESRRPLSPDALRNKPTKREETEFIIKMKLKEIMMSVDLDEVTSKYIRSRLESLLDMDLNEYKSFIDEEMLIILGQMDAPTEIFDHVYLGSEWNASNFEELQKNGVQHILNVTREIDNFFPGTFDYFNVRVYDDDKTNLLKHWDNTFKYISRAKAAGSKVLVHCKMGVSRSASVVIAYAMKAYNWDFDYALNHVKEKRSCIKPNKNFLAQLETYRGMLDAMKNREKLQRSKSETNLKAIKDAKLLPGSEPTPLIQALYNAKRSSESKRMNRRSSSFSPKKEKAVVSSLKQQSQSLENIYVPKRPTDEQKNIRFPGNNGQHYSVTQNQILHIQRNVPPLTLVKTIVNELETIKQKKIDSKPPLDNSNLPPADSNCPQQKSQADISKPKFISEKTIQTSSSHGKSSSSGKCGDTSTKDKLINDIFSSQLDNVFDSEETTTATTTDTRPSLSSSSYSSDVQVRDVGKYFTLRPKSFCNINFSSSYMGKKRDILLRHSSWGSGDNRIQSSSARNRSCMSCDVSNRQHFYSNINSSNMSKMPEKCSYKDMFMQQHHRQPQLSLRQKSKDPPEMEMRQQKRKSDDNTMRFLSSCVVSESVFPTVVMPTATSLTAAASFGGTVGSSRKFPNRCHSEEIILRLGGNASQYKMLSASSPEGFCSTQPCECAAITEDNQKQQLLECSKSDTVLLDATATATTNKFSGNVHNLKMNFEAKANSTSGNKKVRSLPSSPVAPHPRSKCFDHHHHHPLTSQTQSDNRGKDVTTVKGLVNKYQSSESRPFSISSYRSRPKSFYDATTRTSYFTTSADLGLKSLPTAIAATSGQSSTSGSRAQHHHHNQQQQHHHPTSSSSSSSSLLNFNELSKPPPIPPSSSAAAIKSSNPTSSTGSGTAGSGTTFGNLSMTNELLTRDFSLRKIQHHGKSHPLARINISKHVSSAASNTM